MLLTKDFLPAKLMVRGKADFRLLGAGMVWLNVVVDIMVTGVCLKCARCFSSFAAETQVNCGQ